MAYSVSWEISALNYLWAVHSLTSLTCHHWWIIPMKTWAMKNEGRVEAKTYTLRRMRHVRIWIRIQRSCAIDVPHIIWIHDDTGAVPERVDIKVTPVFSLPWSIRNPHLEGETKGTIDLLPPDRFERCASICSQRKMNGYKDSILTECHWLIFAALCWTNLYSSDTQVFYSYIWYDNTEEVLQSAVLYGENLISRDAILLSWHSSCYHVSMNSVQQRINTSRQGTGTNLDGDQSKVCSAFNP